MIDTGSVWMQQNPLQGLVLLQSLPHWGNVDPSYLNEHFFLRQGQTFSLKHLKKKKKKKVQPRACCPASSAQM